MNVTLFVTLIIIEPFPLIEFEQESYVSTETV